MGPGLGPAMLALPGLQEVHLNGIHWRGSFPPGLRPSRGLTEVSSGPQRVIPGDVPQAYEWDPAEVRSTSRSVDPPRAHRR